LPQINLKQNTFIILSGVFLQKRIIAEKCLISHRTMIEKEEHTSFLPNLNGLRFLGALMVFIFHLFTLGREHWGEFRESTWFSALYKLASKGHHGVGLFFVLSGFLITHLLLKEIERNGSINVRNFFVRRVLRIWPLYYLLIIFGFLLFPLLPFGQGTDHSVLNYALFISNLDEIWNGANDPLNFLTISWSVSIEEQFYLSWMLLMFILPFLKKGKYLAHFFGMIIIGTIFFRLNYFADERIMYYHTFANISDLAVGGLTALGVSRLKWDERIINLSKLKVFLLYFIGIALVLLSTVIFKDEFRSIERLVLGSFFAFVVLEQAYGKHFPLQMDRVPGFFQGGKITYGFYMVHCIFIYYWEIGFRSNGLTEHFWQFILYGAIVFVSTYITSRLMMNYIEKPILNLKKYFR
jgi:peptidoglycan/LPS O-acetylase OafA/YrhL